MTTTFIGSLIGLVIVAIGFFANFYLLSQWLVYPKQRRRLRVCKPFFAIGWGLYILGGSVLAPIGRFQGSPLIYAGGDLVAIVGVGLTVYAATRLLQANAAERRADREPAAIPPSDGTWPPPPNLP